MVLLVCRLKTKSNFIFMICASSLMCQSALSVSFFNGTDVDYWGEEPRLLGRKPGARRGGEDAPSPPPRSVKDPRVGEVSIRDRDKEPFSWAAYQDPSQSVFWDDGGAYVPPRPFRVVAADPSPENVRAFREWLNRKSAVVERLNRALRQQEPSSPPPSPTPLPSPRSSPLPPARQASPRVEGNEWAGLDVVLVYDAHCPACTQGVFLHHVPLLRAGGGAPAYGSFTWARRVWCRIASGMWRVRFR